MNRFRGRIRQLEARLRETGADAAAIAAGPNLYYLSGFAGETDRHVLLLVTADGDRVIVSPEAYAGQVVDASWIDEVRSVPRNTPNDIVDGFATAWGRTDGRLLLDDAMTERVGTRLRARLPEASFGLASAILAPMRRRKDEAELAALRRAAAVADEVSAEIRAYGADAIGMTEADLAVDVRAKLHERGGERLSFPVVVAAGPNGARPTQYRHGDRTIRPDEPVVLDFGAFVDHYPSDQTRTVVFEGEPPDRFVDAHEAVLAAIDAGIEAVEPGMRAGDLDAVVRGVIDERGYGDRFTTGTGHGVGLRAHEPPTIAPECDAVLEEGTVCSVEPGIYFEGEFGVRLETLIAVTEAGAEALNTSPFTWKPL